MWRFSSILVVAGAALSVLGAPSPEWAVAVFPSGAEFSLEIAADPQSRRLGYMYRERVGPAEGMLFLFETTSRHGMWMKNCKVPLDIIWLDERWQVVEIARRLPPCPEQGECRSSVPMAAARYVLEVAAGTTEREGLRRGDKLVILSEPELP
jgi:uncharacterized membrane protein (UPF0127 family)